MQAAKGDTPIEDSTDDLLSGSLDGSGNRVRRNTTAQKLFKFFKGDKAEENSVLGAPTLTNSGSSSNLAGVSSSSSSSSAPPTALGASSQRKTVKPDASHVRKAAKLEREIMQIKDTQLLIEEHNRLCILRSNIEAAQDGDLEQIYTLEEELSQELSTQRELEKQLHTILAIRKQISNLLSQAQRLSQS
eukprot:TRINITY_DN1087_c0_g1_i1.p1 TRINITY_DN1087_c0_g1~~TRINITY_DN1087_c0_g1_i1.p1  ORF type:complete len:189 (+),score=93.16 TRINITY_DN1087_c0_g1_i1:192-758(+)